MSVRRVNSGEGSSQGGPSRAKAKEILRDGTVRGHELTPKQKRYMGWIAGGRKPRRGGS